MQAGWPLGLQLEELGANGRQGLHARFEAAQPAIHSVPAPSPPLPLPSQSIKTPVMTLPLRPGLGEQAAADLAVRLKRIRLAEALKSEPLVYCCLLRGAAAAGGDAALLLCWLAWCLSTHLPAGPDPSPHRPSPAGMEVEENVIARTSAMPFGRGRIYTVRMQVGAAGRPAAAAAAHWHGTLGSRRPRATCFGSPAPPPLLHLSGRTHPPLLSRHPPRSRSSTPWPCTPLSWR